MQPAAWIEEEHFAPDALGPSTGRTSCSQRIPRSSCGRGSHPHGKLSYALTEAMDDGHCGLPREELLVLVGKLLEVEQPILLEALTLELRDPNTRHEVTERPPPDFALRYIERMPPGTSYPEIVRRVVALHAKLRPATVAIDATGVGHATIELFERAGLSPFVVTITAGDKVEEDYPRYRVPKRDVISAAQVMLQTDRLKIARDLAHGPLLVRELQNFRMNLDLRKGDDALSWREGTNDDLVLALAVGLWIGEKHYPHPFSAVVGRLGPWFGDERGPEWS